jgi:hypothetical protein
MPFSIGRYDDTDKPDYRTAARLVFTLHDT